MKRTLILSITLSIMIVLASCGVQRPYPLNIEVIGSSGLPYEQQGSIAVVVPTLYQVRVDWDVTPTGAHGVRIIASAGTDYNCKNEIATADVWLPSSQGLSDSGHMHSLGYLFGHELGKFKAGRYAFCVRALMYDRVSPTSLPVYVTLQTDQHSGMGYNYYW